MAVTRCPAGMTEEDRPLVAKARWDATVVVLPRNMVGRTAAGVFDPGCDGPLPDRLRADMLLERLPVAVMEVR